MKEIGIHTPKLTKGHLKFFNGNLDCEVIDGSYGNDTCDSLFIEDLDLQIYLPNSETLNPDKQQWNTFAVQEDVIYGKPKFTVHTADRDAVLIYLKEMLQKACTTKK